MNENFHQKFGHAPLHPLVILVGHFVVGILVLLLIQPPFVQTSSHSLHFNRLVIISMANTLLTYALFVNDVSPSDTFKGAVEYTHRVMELSS